MPVHQGDMVQGGRDDLPVKPNGNKWQRNCKYEPGFCNVLLEMMNNGASYHEVARELGVSYVTMRKWVKEFPEWAQAYELGRDLSQGWWESMARCHLSITEEKDGPRTKFDNKIYSLTMATRFKVREKDDQMVFQIDKDADAEKVKELVKKLHSEEL